MSKLVIMLLLGAHVMLAACTSLRGSDSMVLRRYTSQTRIKETTPSVKITVFALAVPTPTPPVTGVTNLSGDAQAELVKAMSSRTQASGPAGLMQALAMPIQGGNSEPSLRDLTRFSRRLVFSLDNQSHGPANRISEARIYVHPLNGTRFTGWNRIENDYQTVELGKLNLSQERGTEAELGLTLPVASVSPSVSASASSALQEEMMLRQRRTALTGAITPDTAMLLQQGGIGIDLTGNVTADFQMVVPQGGDTTVFIPFIPDSCKQEPIFRRQTLLYPAPSGAGGRRSEPETVWMAVELKYLLRDVQRGDGTMIEGDDDVIFREGTTNIDSVVAIPAEMLRVSVFELRMNDTTVLIQGATQSGTMTRVVPFQFARFEDAASMLAWIRRCKVAAVGHDLFVNRRKLRNDDLHDLHIWRVPLNYPDPGTPPPQVATRQP